MLENNLNCVVTVEQILLIYKKKKGTTTFFLEKIRLPTLALVNNAYSWVRSRLEADVAANGSYFE